MRFSEGLEKIGLGAFLKNGLESVELPATFRTIFQAAFAQCYSLRTVKINVGLEVLGTPEHLDGGGMRLGVFQDSSVEHVELPSTLKRIGYSAFQNCDEL